jgi:hypothetical protein
MKRQVKTYQLGPIPTLLLVGFPWVVGVIVIVKTLVEAWT